MSAVSARTGKRRFPALLASGRRKKRLQLSGRKKLEDDEFTQGVSQG